MREKRLAKCPRILFFQRRMHDRGQRRDCEGRILLPGDSEKTSEGSGTEWSDLFIIFEVNLSL